MSDDKKREPASKQPLGEVKPGDQAGELNEKELDRVSGGHGEKADPSSVDLFRKVPR
jgi:bacteriocin-like protein